MAMQTDQVIYTEPYVDAFTGKMIISMAIAVENKGVKVGVVGFDIEVTTLIDITNAIEIEDHSYAFLVDQQGNFVTHPNTAYLPTKSESVLLWDGAEGRYGVIDKSLAYQKMQTVEVKDYDEVKKFIMLQPIAKCNWILGVAVPMKEFTAELIGMMVSSAILVLVGIAAIIVVVSGLVKRLFKPIEIGRASCRERVYVLL